MKPSLKSFLRCWNKYGSFIYKFKGVKFTLYGTYDLNHHVIDIDLDGIKIAQINESGHPKEYMHIYESDVCNYREHAVRILATNQAYEQMFVVTAFSAKKSIRVRYYRLL